MDSLKRTSEYRKLLPFIAKASGDVGGDTQGEDIQALILALSTHKTSDDHDGRYYTETEIGTLLGYKADKTITLTAGNGLTGGGDLSANRTFTVGAGTGITVNTDDVQINLDADLHWTGLHVFDEYLSTASIYPTLSDSYDLGDYNRLWRKIWGSELSAIVFSQYTQVLLGGWFTVSKGEGVVKAAVTAAATTIDLGSNNFATNDIIVFRGVDTGGASQVEYMKVGTLVSGTTYNVTRNLDGTGANNWADGSVYGNWGQTGNGRIELNAYDTPRMSVYSQGAAYNDAKEQIRIGDLNGQWGYGSALYGAAFGSYETGKANITIDPTNGIRIRNYSTTVIQLTGTQASFENTIYLGTNGKLLQGTNAATFPTNFTGNAIWNDSGIMKVSGYNAGVPQWYGGSDGKFYAGGGAVRLDSLGIRITVPTGGPTDPGQIFFSAAGWSALRVGSFSLPIGDIFSYIISESPYDDELVIRAYYQSTNTSVASIGASGGFTDDDFAGVRCTSSPGNSLINISANAITLSGAVGIGTAPVAGTALTVSGNAVISGVLAGRMILMDPPVQLFSGAQFNVGTTYTYDVNTVGVPTTARAVFIRCYASWATAGGNNWIEFRKTGTSNGYMVLRGISTLGTDGHAWVAVNTNGQLSIIPNGDNTTAYCGGIITAYLE